MARAAIDAASLEDEDMLDTGRFDLTNEFNILRIICGAFFIPHSIGKITEWKDYFDILTVLGQIAKSSPGIAAAFVKSLFSR